MTNSSLKILLLQAREHDDPARIEEVQSFAIRAEVPADCITPHNLLDGPPDRGAVDRFDLIFIGGSGHYYVSRGDLPRQDVFFGELREWVADKKPIFASCFGFQCLVEALGGSIVYDPKSMEVGTHELTLTDSGQKDELFCSLPARFFAQLGHKDRATSLPKGIVNLASSELSPLQAFRIDDTPIWATQFHPELDWETNRDRFIRYLDGYAAHMSEVEQQELLEAYHDSPESNQLLVQYLRLVFS